ncbi:MAG TPA: SDR family oxidoreductase [Candidatus Saccharimonadales bacterium]|nr:SDR family oxidoreductase [Candidatus Saccharimonadales bacterium]
MKTILISGGSEGLGKAIAQNLVRNNNVIILARDESKLKAAAEELGCRYVVGDVRDYAAMQKMCDELGAIDCLINNAGVWLQGPLDKTDDKRIQETIDTNVNGTISLTKAVLPRMKQQKSGLIINVISQGGLNTREGWPIYTASKWAITGFTKAMQQELEPFGIGVTGLYPATLNTEMFAKSGVPKDVSHALNPDDVAKMVEFIVSMDGILLLPEVGVKQSPTAK